MISHEGPVVPANRQSGCLDESDALNFIHGRLESSRAISIEHHIDGCAFCRRLLSAAARGAAPERSGGDPPPGASTHDHDSGHDDRSARASTHVLGPGHQIGRYAITGLRGVGSMGIVYAAHDAELDRPVALKLLRYDVVAAGLDLSRARLV